MNLWKTRKNSALFSVQTYGSGMVVEDEDVIEACQQGDADAFRALFEAYKDRVYSIALRFSGDPAAAMDIAQETFLKLLSRIGEYAPKPASIRGLPAGGE